MSVVKFINFEYFPQIKISKKHLYADVFYTLLMLQLAFKFSIFWKAALTVCSQQADKGEFHFSPLKVVLTLFS